ncbi:MAG: DUF1819 family protein [Desulfobacteraceae bacterium]|nr:DUF1819 family protein [Desulfobacteraceae bacterium]
MKELINIAELGLYDTAINIIGGLRDCNVIFKAIDSHFNPSDSLKALVQKRNEFNLRTEKSRTRIERAVRKNFLQFANQDHQVLMPGVFQDDVPLKDKELLLVWQFALNNRLFREITSNVFAKTYHSGRISISKDDIIAYLKDFLDKNKALQISWSQNTINTLATKYLNLMSKLNFVNTGRVKSFRHIRPSSEAQVLFLYFAKLFVPTMGNILTNSFLPISFMPPEDLRERLKRLSIKGLFDMNFNGVTLNIQLTHSYKGIGNALYNRS